MNTTTVLRGLTGATYEESHRDHTARSIREGCALSEGRLEYRVHYQKASRR